MQVCVRTLNITLAHMELNKIRKHITKSHSFVDSWLINQTVADACHLVEVTVVHGLSGFAIALKILNSSQKHALLHVLIYCCRLIKLTFSFFHSIQCFFIVAILIDFDLSTGIVEVCETLKCFGFRIKLNNGLHDIRVVVPVLIL
ncbi:MAG: hypothetical protein ACK521_10565 [bacterium]